MYCISKGERISAGQRSSLPLATSPSWGQGDDHGSGGIGGGGGSSGGGLVAEEEVSIIFAVSLGGPRR